MGCGHGCRLTESSSPDATLGVSTERTANVHDDEDGAKAAPGTMRHLKEENCESRRSMYLG